MKDGKRGFTLIELLLSIVIGSFLLIYTYQIYINVSRFDRNFSKNINPFFFTENIFNTIRTELRYAYSYPKLKNKMIFKGINSTDKDSELPKDSLEFLTLQPGSKFEYILIHVSYYFDRTQKEKEVDKESYLHKSISSILKYKKNPSFSYEIDKKIVGMDIEYIKLNNSYSSWDIRNKGSMPDYIELTLYIQQDSKVVKYKQTFVIMI